MGADFTLVVSGFLAAKSAAAEFKCHEVNPHGSVQVCCVWVADFSALCRNLQREEGYLFAESGMGLIICFQVRILAAHHKPLPIFRVDQWASGGLRCV
jgi:hypothetical protein